MKNIMVYLSKNKKIEGNDKTLLHIQIDNSLDLGWSLEDLMIITNFPYEYRGVIATVISDKWFCDFQPINTKLSAIVGVFDETDLFWLDESGMSSLYVYWVHDIDAFQLESFEDDEIDIVNWDMGICYFGRMKKWSGGSIFFYREAYDIFEAAYKRMYEKKMIDEDALTELTFDDEKIHNRIKRMNVTYNFVPFNIGTCWKQANPKPLRVVHFNPFEGVKKLGIENCLDFYKGNNRLGKQFLNDRIINLFKVYGL